MLVMAIGFLGSAITTAPALLIGSNVLKGLGVGLSGGMALGMVADTVALDQLGQHQPQSVSTAITFLYGWVPAIMAAAMFVIFLLFYHCERDIKKLEAQQ